MSTLHGASKHITLSGFQHHYIDLGHGEKTLILLHGFSSSLDAYEQVIPCLAQRYRVLALDWLGFGKSDKPSQIVYSLELYSSLLREFLSKTVPEFGEVIAIGHSMGGKYLLANEVWHPRQFSRLILVDTDGFIHVPGFVGMASTWGVRHVLHKVVSSRTFVKKTMQSVYYNPNLITDAHFTRNWQMVKSKENYNAMMSLNKHFKHLDLERNGIRKKLNENCTPTLILWGKNDVFIKPKYAYIAHREIANSRLHFIDQCGHVPMVEQPEKFCEEVVAFIEHKHRNT